jgi:hypothetical protein
MRISHKHKYMFFSKPKSASTTIREILNDHCDLKHSEHREIKNILNPKNPFYSHIPPYEAEIQFQNKNWNINEYSLFTTVRNPFSRIVSAYKHMTRKNMKWNEKNWSFERFVKSLILKNNIKNYKDAKWLYYSIHDHFYFIKDLKKSTNLTTFKIEDGMTPILNYLKLLNIPITSEFTIIKNQHSYNGKTYKDFYTDELYEIVKEYYKKEIKHFNYKF